MRVCERSRREPGVRNGALDLIHVVTAAIAGGASMLLTSQNRNTVSQTSVANVRELTLAAVVAHRPITSKRRYSGMRRTRRPFGLTMQRDHLDSVHRPERGDRQPPAGCLTGPMLPSRLWASLVLSKMSRG
jgi:hypothetical protein